MYWTNYLFGKPVEAEYLFKYASFGTPESEEHTVTRMRDEGWLAEPISDMALQAIKSTVVVEGLFK